MHSVVFLKLLCCNCCYEFADDERDEAELLMYDDLYHKDKKLFING